SFIAGADIEEFRHVQSAVEAERMSRMGQDVLVRLERLRVPVVAAIHGPCLGGGLEMALACRYRVIRADAIAAGERHLEPAAQTRTVDRGDDRHPQSLEAHEHVLAHPAHPLGLDGGLHVAELLDVGAGDERVRLAGGQYHPFDELILIDAQEDPLKLADQRRAERVHRLARAIDGDDENVAVEPRGERRTAGQALRVGRHALSITIACPRPPAAQTVINPNCPPRRTSSLASVVRMRPPVAPNGCPIAIDPPITLRRARSTSPTGSANPARSAQACEVKPARLHSTCAANASCISIRSISPRPSPARSNATGAASTGAMSSCSPGSSAA